MTVDNQGAAFLNLEVAIHWSFLRLYKITWKMECNFIKKQLWAFLY